VPDNIILEKSIYFTFDTFNNQVENEVLIVGLKLAQELGVK